MIDLYSKDDVLSLKKKRDVTLIFAILLSIFFAIGIVLSFLFLNRENRIFLELVGILSIAGLGSTLLFCLLGLWKPFQRRYVFLKQNETIAELLLSCQQITISEERNIRNGISFVIVHVSTKEGNKILYLEESKLPLLKGKRITLLGVKNHVIVSYQEGEQ